MNNTERKQAIKEVLKLVKSGDRSLQNGADEIETINYIFEQQVKDNDLSHSVNLRSFGMVRWYSNTDEDVACVSIEKAKEYVDKYNKLSGKEECYVDTDVYLLLNEA